MRRQVVSVALALCALLPAALSVRADIALYGGNDEVHARLQALITEELTPTQLGTLDLAITVGAEALTDYCEADGDNPVLATYLYASSLAGAAASCRQSVAAIPVDPPLDVLYRLGRAMFPESAAATLIRAGTASDGAPATTRPYRQLPVPPDGVARGLGRLIQEGHWEVFLMPIDAAVFKGADYRLALETLFRHRKPVVVSIPSLLPQGAVAAAYYTPEQLDAALRQTLRRWVETGELVAAPPGRIQVQVNPAVLRNGYGRVIAERDVRALEVEVNSGD
ncbi:MAG: hypothetical protein ACK5HY_10695 [Parahaliea sp.]